MKMLEIHHGSFRTAILIWCLVIKIPNVSKIIDTCRKLRVSREKAFATREQNFKTARDQIVAAIQQNWKTVRDRMLAGIQQNWSEYKCWRVNLSDRLAPVYFSLGLFSIVRRNDGVEPEKEEWAAILKSLPEDAYQYLCEGVDFHSYHQHNVRRTDNGYQFIDYGATSGDDGGHTITEFLTRWKDDIEEKLRLPR